MHTKAARRIAFSIVGLLLASLLLTFISLQSSPTAHAASYEPGDVRVMPLGDSITQGATSSIGGYRGDLWQMLLQGGYNVDFVGSLHDGLPGSDIDHEGHVGYWIGDIQNGIVNWLNAAQPQIIMMQIGTNDIWKSSDSSYAPAALSTLVDTITSTLPNAIVVVAQITPLNLPQDTAVVSYNATIPGMVQSKVAAGKHVQYIDMYDALLKTDLPDNVHPSDAGYMKMAVTWYNKLKTLLTVQSSLLNRSGWTATANVNASTANNALDNSTSTSWDSNSLQAVGDYFQVDMGAPQTIDRIIMDESANQYNCPISYRAYVSNDGTNFGNPIAGGGCDNSTLPHSVVRFPTQTARYIKLVLMQGSAYFNWTIDDFNVGGPTGALSRVGWTASASSSDTNAPASNALDGNATTRWGSGAAQSNGLYFQVDMGAAQNINAISLDNTGSPYDYPRGYSVSLSNDGTSWGSAVASGSGSGNVTTISFPTQSARYIRVTQTGSDGAYWWSIYEFNVYGPIQFGGAIENRSSWAASASNSYLPDFPASNALDGNASTRWGSGVAQSNGLYFQVDLAYAQSFSKIVLDNTGSPNDYPRGYSVTVSTDGTTWSSAVATGTGSGTVTTITFPTQYARYIRVTETGNDGAYWWSIYEFNVYS